MEVIGNRTPGQRLRSGLNPGLLQQPKVDRQILRAVRNTRSCSFYLWVTTIGLRAVLGIRQKSDRGGLKVANTSDRSVPLAFFANCSSQAVPFRRPSFRLSLTCGAAALRLRKNQRSSGLKPVFFAICERSPGPTSSLS